MKLTWKQIEPFIKSPDPTARVILVYGPDYGLMKERVKIMGKTVVEDLNDPFNAATLSGDTLLEDPARLNDEALAMSMMGGARLIRIEDAGDKIAPIVKDYLDNASSDNLVIIEAGNLGPKSALRLLCERAKNAAALPCYVEAGRDVASIIRDHFQEEKKRIDTEALQWLTANIAGDRGRIRAELEKLSIYMGDHDHITLRDVTDCCGEAGAQDIESLIYAVASGNTEETMTSYQKLLAEGVAVIAILRSLQNHFRRLHYVGSRMNQGERADEAMKSLSPPVFFKVADTFKAQLRRWPQQRAMAVLTRLTEIEAQTKKTGTPVETLCAQALLSISAR